MEKGKTTASIETACESAIETGCESAIQSYVGSLKAEIDFETSLIRIIIRVLNRICGKYPEIMYEGTNHTTFYWRLNSVPVEIEFCPRKISKHPIVVYNMDHHPLAQFLTKRLDGIYTVNMHKFFDSKIATRNDSCIPTEMIDELYEALTTNIPGIIKDPHIRRNGYANYTWPAYLNNPALEYFDE